MRPNDCKVIDNRCREDSDQGNYGCCQRCPYTTRTRPVTIDVSLNTYWLFADLCAVDKTEMAAAMGQAVEMVGRSIRRHV